LLVANEIMETLRKREVPGMAPRLFSLANNKNVLDVVRDYSIQHYFLSEKRAIRSSHPDKRGVMAGQLMDHAETLVARTRSLDSTLYGTTLMGIAALADGLKGAELEMIRARSAKLVLPALAGGRPGGVVTRVSAIQVAARLGLTEAGPAIGAIALDDNAGLTERLSAIAALKQFPEEIDIGQLEAVAGRHKRLGPVVDDTLTHYRNNH